MSLVLFILLSGHALPIGLGLLGIGCEPRADDGEMNRAVFLDLHGTLVLPLAVDRLGALRVIAGVPQAVAKLCDAGFLCPVVTVQSRIAKGTFPEIEFRE